MAVKMIKDINAGDLVPARLDDRGYAITQANPKEFEPRMGDAVVAMKGR